MMEPSHRRIVTWSLFSSPDGAWVGFSDQADGTIKRVAVTGGPALTISEVGASGMRGATWGEDDRIVFGTNADDGLWQVSVGGGAPEPLTTLDEAQGEQSHRWPELLPGGEAVLFTIFYQGLDIDTAQIAVLDLVTGEQRVLVSGGSYPKYTPTGHMVYGFQGTLRAVPFDTDQLTVTGDSVGILEGGRTLASGVADFALAQDGSLGYVAAGAAEVSPPRTLVWVDRAGREDAILAPVRTYVYPRLSPDGTKVALDIRDQENDIWVWDVTRTTLTRLTFGAGQDRAPVWTPDGQRIAFSSEQEGAPNLSWQAADGTGTVERMSESTNDQFPSSFSPDGSQLVFTDNRVDLAVLTLAEEPRTMPLVQTTFIQRNGEVSPDGRWLAYQSNEFGRFEVYVRPFPDVDQGHWQVSTGGGLAPLWARSGEELFFWRRMAPCYVRRSRVRRRSRLTRPHGYFKGPTLSRYLPGWAAPMTCPPMVSGS